MKTINLNNQDLGMHDSNAIEHPLELATQNQDIYSQSLENLEKPFIQLEDDIYTQSFIQYLENLEKPFMQITDELVSEIIEIDFSVMQEVLDDLLNSITDYNTKLAELAFAAIEDLERYLNVVELAKESISNYEPLVEKAVDSMPIEAHKKSKLLECALNDLHNQPVAIMLSLLATIISLISILGDRNDSDKQTINININIDYVDQLVVVRDELEDTIQELLQIGSSEDH